MDRPFFVSNLQPKTIKDTLYGVLQSEKYIAIDTYGLEELKKQNKKGVPRNKRDGRFILLLKKNKNKYICRTDDMGQETLFYYCKKGKWAISNSLMYLAEELSKNKLKLTLNKTSIYSMAISNQSLFGGQMLNHQTIFDEIKLLPIDRQIEIRKQVNNFSFSIKDTPRHSTRKKIYTKKQYKNMLARYIIDASSNLQSLLDSELDEITCGISGGKDSRVNLGLLLMHRETISKFGLFTKSYLSEDFPVVKKLEQYLDIDVYHNNNRIGTSGYLQGREAYDLWKYGSAGVYVPIYKPIDNTHRKTIRISGSNFEARSYAKKTPLQRYSAIKNDKNLSAKSALHVADSFLQSFAQINIDPKDKNAMKEHYIAFRSRLHYGRTWYKRFERIPITPLLDNSLKLMSEWRQKNTGSKDQVLCDILYAISPKLVKIKFDKEEKNFSKEMINEAKKLKIHKKIRQKAINKKIYYQPQKNNIKRYQDGETFEKIFLKEFNKYKRSKDVTSLFDAAFINAATTELDQQDLLQARKASLIVSAGIATEIVSKSSKLT